ncbi:pyruvate, phosphate dikinase [Pseudactinotalea suaedae]|uniref:pyruvate, phosphate dikinase n=1 Tax=Pseudactinotalea suaedae TaxID=1524924 RepID=UPI0012E28174|nr:pyruvate, phosphate dikinase [Pseudactinotalea suaedae]
MTQQRYLYDLADGDASMKALLGGKGAGVAQMLRLGVPVPDGFTVSTAASVDTTANDGEWPAGLWEETLAALTRLEERTGRGLGDPERPLLVSVRSGAVVSMPGMMDTILNLGISDATVEALGREAGDPRFAWDSYRRFLQMYGEVVEGVPAHAYEDALTAMKRDRGAAQDTDLSTDDLRELVEVFKIVSRTHIGSDLPADPQEALRRAIDAVFRSWLNPRAGVYRRANGIPDDLGTAVNVMQMVFGNRGETSATGVCFTRNPATGAKELYGEFLLNAQGEDVVAGIRTPRPLAEMEAVLPQAYAQLLEVMGTLESYYRDMQDIEFTVEDTVLYLLQTRAGKRTAAAALKVARDLVEEGVLTREEAIGRIEPAQLDQLLHPALGDHGQTPATRGLAASPGAAVGEVVLDSDTAERRGKAGEAVVLVRWETTPDDIAGTLVAQGVLTAHGGMTSHAAVVARGMGKPCVAGASDISIDTDAKTLRIGDVTLAEGDVITLDGSTGEVFAGALELVPPQINADFAAVVGWADEVRRLGVRANADNGPDAAKAREFGAEGIGLCRTEHMFMEQDRLPAVRKMILAGDDAERATALEEILPMQQADFEAILEAMSGLPVTIRLLDPPLHEFLPSLVDQALEVQRLELTEGTHPTDLRHARALLAQIKKLTEQNPMLGTRGVRLALLHPEIPQMQVRAIARAAFAVADRGSDPRVEIMVPLVAYAEELRRMRAIIETTLEDEFDRAGRRLEIPVGTMIELPRAAVVADQIAEHADFFSFGTNDLTQTGVGISRDDAEGAFLSHYLDSDVVPDNPFSTIDVDGVGGLVELGAERGRSARPDLKLGVCGEHGGDPASIAVFERLGLDYVSCSPYRVPIARFAAAQATLE